MSRHTISGVTTLARVRDRYEQTDKKCPDCGYVDEAGNWESETDGRRIVYRYVCPSCGSAREHTFDIER